MASTVLLLGFLAIAATTDVLRRRIYNWTTYPGLLTAFGFHGVFAVLLAYGWTDRTTWYEWGAIPLVESLGGFLLCGFLMLACFVIFRVGGGDVKLLAMIGAFLGMEEGLEVLLWTFVLGAAMALIVLVWRVGPWRLFVRVLRQAVYILRIGGWSELTPEEKAQMQAPLFLAPAALAAVIIVRFALIERLGV